MKKIVLAVSLSAIMLFLCGCGTNIPDTPSGNVFAERETAAVAATETPSGIPSDSDTLPSASAGIVIPCETKVYAAEGELAGVRPLFESYMLEDDLLAFAVSAVFNGEAYIMGFLYKNYENILPFSRVIGLKQNGTAIEEAFVSGNYDNPKEWEPENFYKFMEEPFSDTQTFETDGMLVVKTNENLSEDAGFHNFFLINEQGLLDNHININLNEPCELFEYRGKLLLNESYTWYEFTVKDKKIVLNEITNYDPYVPKTDKSDFVITLEDFKPGAYDESTGKYKDESYIKAVIGETEVLTKEDFNADEEDPGYGYLSKKKFKISVGTRIILLYPPGMRINCFISGETDDSGLEHSSLPGAVILRAQEPGEYTVQIENDSVYQINITAE